jgi:hypothetical protein
VSAVQGTLQNLLLFFFFFCPPSPQAFSQAPWRQSLLEFSRWALRAIW